MTTQNDEARLPRADELRFDLMQRTGGTAHRSIDILNEYRTWLDFRKIPAETEDGWPTEEAYNDANRQAFARWWNG